MLFKPLGVLFVVRAPQLEEPVAEAEGTVGIRDGENEPVGDVDELAGVVLVEEARQFIVLERVQRGNLAEVGRHVIVLARFGEGRIQRVGVDFAVERRIGPPSSHGSCPW